MIDTAQAFGIDIGGSGIKSAPVNLHEGRFALPRLKTLTPQPSTPEAVASIITEHLQHFEVSEDVPVGIAFPAPFKQGGTIPFISNLDQSWVGVNLESFFSEVCGRRVVAVNDADAAGLAEQQFGAGKGHGGLVITTTLGTGIGTALIYNGTLIPSSELGHIELPNGKGDAEKYASSSLRERKEMSYEKWAKRLTKYYRQIEMLLSPDLIIVGGGVSRKGDKFIPLIDINTPIVAATLENEAGIIGAAYQASLR